MIIYYLSCLLLCATLASTTYTHGGHYGSPVFPSSSLHLYNKESIIPAIHPFPIILPPIHKKVVLPPVHHHYNQNVFPFYDNTGLYPSQVPFYDAGSLFQTSSLGGFSGADTFRSSLHQAVYGNTLGSLGTFPNTNSFQYFGGSSFGKSFPGLGNYPFPKTPVSGSY